MGCFKKSTKKAFDLDSSNNIKFEITDDGYSWPEIINPLNLLKTNNRIL